MERKEVKVVNLNYGAYIFLTAVLLILLYIIFYYTPIRKPSEEESILIEKQEQYIREIDSLVKLSKQADTIYIESLKDIKIKTKRNKEELQENLKLPVDSVRYWNNILLINDLGKQRWGKD